jgi:hypothetical protein
MRDLSYISEYRYWILVALTAIFYIACISIFIWGDLPHGLYAGTDGRFFKNFANLTYGHSDFLGAGGPYQHMGLGSSGSFVNYWLIPAYIPFLIADSEIAPLASTAISAFFLIVSSTFIARTMGLGRVESLSIGQLTVLVLFPFQYEFGILFNYVLNPAFAYTYSLLVIVLAFWIKYFQAKALKEKFSLLVLINAISLYLASVDPIGFGMNALWLLPLFLLVGLERKNIASGVYAAAITISAFLMFGLLNYLIDIMNSLGKFVDAALFMHRPDAYLLSFTYSRRGFITFGLLLIGLLFNFPRSPILRRFSIALISLFVIIFLHGLAWIEIGYNPLPWSPSYAELAIFPIFLIVSGSGWIHATGLLYKRLISKLNLQPTRSTFTPSSTHSDLSLTKIHSILLLVAPLLLVAGYASFLLDKRGQIYLEREKSYTLPDEARLILKDYAIQGKDFRGYVFVFPFNPSKGHIHPVALYNELWALGVPTLNEYGFVPASTTIFWSLAVDKVNKIAATAPAGFDKSIFEALNISLIVHNESVVIPGFQLWRKISLSESDEALYFYARSGELKLFSPVRVETMASVHQTIRYSTNDNFDWSNQAILDKGLTVPLSKASYSNLGIVRGGYEFSASSPSVSLVILPIRFTHCLNFSGSQEGVELVRANGFLTGVIFSGQVNVKIGSSLSPFNSMCLRRDFEDFSDEIKAGVFRMQHELDQTANASVRQNGSAFRGFLYSTETGRNALKFLAKLEIRDGYLFPGTTDACSERGDGQNFLTDHSDAEHYERDERFPLRKIVSPRDFDTLRLIDYFAGNGFAPAEVINGVPFRRLDFGFNEGYVLYNSDRRKLTWVEIDLFPESLLWSPNFSVSFNGKSLPYKIKTEGRDFITLRFSLEGNAVPQCHGWIEVLFSANRNNFRPEKQRFDKWMGWSVLVSEIRFGT